MTVEFTGYVTRETVVAMLEKPVRIYFSVVPEDEGYAAQADIDAILRELDRFDRVNAAIRSLRQAEHEHDAKVLAEYLKVVPAADDDMCVAKTYGRGKTRPHRARTVINGAPYCGTHEKRALEYARWHAIGEHRAEYVEDAALRAIVDADRELRKERQGY